MNAAMPLNLKKLRLDRGLTQDELAEMAGLSKAFMSQLENGSRNPSAQTLDAIARALNVQTGDLFAQAGFAEPSAPETAAHRVLRNLDAKTELDEPDLKIGTDGTHVQVIATVNREGLRRLIRQLQAMEILLEA